MLFRSGGSSALKPAESHHGHRATVRPTKWIHPVPGKVGSYLDRTFRKSDETASGPRLSRGHARLLCICNRSWRNQGDPRKQTTMIARIFPSRSRRARTRVARGSWFGVRCREQNSPLLLSQIFFLLFLNLCALCVFVVNHLLRVLPGTPLAAGVDHHGV